MLQTEVRIHSPTIEYPVHVGYNILGQLRSVLDSVRFPKHVVLITTEALHRTIFPAVGRALSEAGRSAAPCFVPEGDAAKSSDTYVRVLEQIAKTGRSGEAGILALGGGALGDLAGFVAGTLRRGVPYGILPTTLLSQVDSSIGGKVAINLREGKNLVGLFYQPAFVLSDVAFLKSLSPRQVSSGLAEVVKYALIADAEFLGFLEGKAESLLALDADTLVETVFRCVKIKAEVVGLDPYDQVAVKGIRARLNFGHTIGHAIEAAAGYDVITHGEAISVGMACAADLSRRMGLVEAMAVERTENALRRFHLPVRLPELKGGDGMLPPALGPILHHMKFDKKFSGAARRFVLLERIGKAAVSEKVPNEWVEEVLRARGAA
ncbi:MAG: 3-dehydroquinate synthase [Nitrospirae bacterium]|nr:3-dehydroquinate synthase [Nitrospirota bacterium]